MRVWTYASQPSLLLQLGIYVDSIDFCHLASPSPWVLPHSCEGTCHNTDSGSFRIVASFAVALCNLPFSCLRMVGAMPPHVSKADPAEVHMHRRVKLGRRPTQQLLIILAALLWFTLEKLRGQQHFHHPASNLGPVCGWRRSTRKPAARKELGTPSGKGGCAGAFTRWQVRPGHVVFSRI